MKTAEDLALEIKGSMDKVDKAVDKVREIAENALGKAEAGEALTKSVKDQADEALTSVTTLKGEFAELEQKLARRQAEEASFHTAGQLFTEADEFKSFADQTRPRGRVVVEVKDITSLTTDAAGSMGTMIRPQQVGQVDLPRQRLTIRALLAQGQISTNSLEYDREEGFTNNAAPVAEGAVKPQSEIQYTTETAPVRTIAHWMRASVQVLADIPALRSMIDNRLRYGLALVEEAQLLNGSGTGENLEGLITAATAYAAPGGLTAATLVDTVRLGTLQAFLALYPPNGIVMNPIDMAFIEMMKDADGRYLLGNPQGTLTPTLWGLPVVATPAIGVDKFLVGAFNMAAQIFDRQNATVEVSTEDQDNFVRNKVTIRAEQRLALAIYRPEAIIYGDLGRVA